MLRTVALRTTWKVELVGHRGIWLRLSHTFLWLPQGHQSPVRLGLAQVSRVGWILRLQEPENRATERCSLREEHEAQ